MSTDRQPHRITLNGATMGTRYSCVFHSARHDGHEVLGRRLHEAVTQVDAVMSNWQQTSDLCRLNGREPGLWCSVPASLIHVLDAALQIEAASNGAFDIGVAPEVAAWGFGPEVAGRILPATVAPKRPATRDTLELDKVQMRVRKHAPLMLDLSGIAKGYGVDRLGEALSAMGVENWLVGIDGEMRGRGTRPDGSAWVVGHERPVPDRREIMGVIELSDLAVATSGTYRHFRTTQDGMVSHTIDPATGRPIKGVLASATVLAATCMEADAWATAILVDGHWPPRSFAAPQGIEAIVCRG